MNISELDSFVLKVRQLWKAGYNAHLHVETHQGHAWCNLQVHLGPAAVPGPVRPQQQQQQQMKTKRKSPSYIRRKEARAAARAVAARESAAEAVENSINDAVKIAEEAIAKKEAEKAALARVVEAVVNVGRGVAATAKKIAEEAIARKMQAEEAADKKATEEAEAKRAEEAIATPQTPEPVNDPISPNKDRISPSVYLKHREVYRYKDCDDMKIPPRWPAPAWFCELLGTRNHHGNVKFIVSQPLRTFIGHHENNVMTNYIFVKRLWAAMSHLPLNIDTGFLPSVEFAEALYGTQDIPFEQIKWSTLCTSLHEHVYFNSTHVGVFSGRKMKR